ncbi:MAG TPA: NAD-dependent epimerase/dehydratase family protein [Bacteroidia bacterium]|nr:NAD-dependent epimerase/dehydratase family protein [Bacteroidia bacterium]
MKILVTGANGFLGTHVLRALEKKHEVTGLVRRETRPGESRMVVFRDTDDPVIENEISRAEVVLHIASQLHGPYREMYAANVSFTKKLVDLALKHGCARFIYISSENVTQGNSDIYSTTKMLAEKEAERFPGALILRPTVIYGPGDEKYVGRLAGIIAKYPFVPVLGDGKAKFQFIYVEDIVHILENAIEKHITGTWTIAGPESISYDQFMQVLMEAMKKKKRLLHVPLWLLRPLSHAFNLIFRDPPLTPSQIDNLSKDRAYDISGILKQFSYSPTYLRTGLQKMLENIA